jgi:site-specific DNA-methyltransferase (adenine-specific)
MNAANLQRNVRQPEFNFRQAAKKEQKSVHFMSKTCEWSTPQWLFEALDAEFGFTLDPCSSSTNFKCAKHYTKNEDGLAQDWSDECVFMNPPYGSEIARWMEKAFESSKRGATVVCLIPARTDTKWFSQYAMKGEIRFLCGRLQFGDSKNSAPFPSAVVVFRPSGFVLKSIDMKEEKP